MPSIDKIFTGKLNLDDSVSLMDKYDYLESLNITKNAVEGSSDMAVTNIVANRSVPYTLPSGTNQVIGAQGDPLRNVMYYFVWNSNLKHSILKYNNTLRVTTKLLENLTDTGNVDILAFNRYKKIIHIDIIHRDEGDLVYWVEADTGRPRKINEATIQSFVPVSEDIINAAKNAPQDFFIVGYRDNSLIKVNNLRKKLFQFAYSWIYKDGEESTLSPLSKTPLPVDAGNLNIANDPTKNNNISVYVFGGGKDYQKIKLYGRECIGTTYSDYFLIETFNRDDYNINPGAAFEYRFYNDGVYPFQDPIRTGLLFDWIPDKANAQKLANGNVLIYGGLTEGFNNLARADVDVQMTSGVATPEVASISAFYTGLSYIIVNIGPVITTGVTYHIQFNYVSGGVPGSVSFNYVTPLGATLTSIATAMAAGITSGLITGIYSSPGVFQVAVGGLGVIISDVIVNTSASGVEDAAPSWNWYSKYRFALIYFNDLMKPLSITSFVGASTDTNDFVVTTPDFSVSSNVIQVPFINASINHTPPEGATKYQWLRTTNLTTSKFLYWITNDYQTDADYLYLCIQNLDYTKDKNTGFVPSYEFTQGDHLRVIAKYNAGALTVYDVQLDFEIIGVEDRTMNSPASIGRFIKVAKPTTLPSLAYSSNMIIELYTPLLNVSDTGLVFYEWDEVYSIISVPTQTITYTLSFGTFQVGEIIIEAFTNVTATVLSVSPTQLVVDNLSGTLLNGLTFTGMTSGAAGTITSLSTVTFVKYHAGQIQNQTATQPATFQWFDGDVYFKDRDLYLNVNAIGTISEFTMDANYNDYFISAVNSNGRAWPLQPEAKVQYFPTLIRFGQAYQPDTNINGLNRFYGDNFYDKCNRSYGDILKLSVRGSYIHVGQKLKIGSIPVLLQIVKDGNGTDVLATSDQLLNQIVYYSGDYGVGDTPESWVDYNNSSYFTYSTRGIICRLAGDGIIPISVLYKVNSWATTNLPLRTGNSKIYGVYDPKSNNYIIAIEQIGINEAATLSFDEETNQFESFLSYHPEMMGTLGDLLVTFKNGGLWTHDSPTEYNNFYGVAYESSITAPFNDGIRQKKTFTVISEIANTIWDCPTIWTNVNTYGAQRQETNLVEAEFRMLEGSPSSAIKKDVHSRGGKINGDFIKGSFMVVKFRKTSASSLVNLVEATVNYSESPLTSK